MYDTLGVDEVNNRNKFSHDGTSLRLSEALFAFYAIEHFPTLEQFHHDVDMKL
jgi:hypothetical protein